MNTTDKVLPILHNGESVMTMVYPESSDACVRKVLSGEYGHVRPPDFPPIRRILDIGANVGAFAVWAYIQYPGAWIDCYEPNPGAIEYLRSNAPPGTRIHPVAVGGSDGAVDLHIGQDWGWSSTYEGMNPYEDQICQVTQISAASLPPADLLKIDTEGCELDILSAYLLSGNGDHTGVVMFEWHREDDRLAVEGLLAVHGFRCFGIRFDRNTLGQQVWMRSKSKWDEKSGGYIL